MLSPFLAIGYKWGLTENRVFFQINTKHIHLWEETHGGVLLTLGHFSGGY
jgi:hypothetical protein